MEIVVLIFRFLHLIGFASIFGGLFVQMKAEEKQVNPAMLHGAFTQVVSGVVLMLLQLSEIDHIKIGIKFALLVALLVVFLIKRKGNLSKALYFASFGVVIVITAVAVFWPGGAAG